jgi:hypothetical protein
MVMMLVKFFSFCSAGCSFTTAARHVWYGRFERKDHGEQQEALAANNSVAQQTPALPTTGSSILELQVNERHYHPSSSIGHTRRLAMRAFLVSALLQAIKVFAMQGIPKTKV